MSARSRLASFNADLPKDEILQMTKAALINVAESIATEPIAQGDFNRVLAESNKNIEGAPTAADGAGLYLSEPISEGDWRLLFWERDQIRKVTIADLRRIATKYLVGSNITGGLFIPEDKPLRAEILPPPDTTAMLKVYKEKL